MSNVALYMRLSVEERMETQKDESRSIQNQRSYLTEFVLNNPELKMMKIEEYVDDGYSGTNVNRPAFQRLMTDIKSGKVKCIIVKDLSRFMRDYITLRDYLENIFPFLGIRFIAINDGYDSSKEQGNGLDMDVQFKSLLYDYYTKDVSVKLKSVMNVKKASVWM